MLRISQIRLPAQKAASASKQEELAYLADKVKKILKGFSFDGMRIAKKSLDARDKQNLMYTYSVDVHVSDPSFILKKVHNNNIMLIKETKYRFPYSNPGKSILSPVIVGAGPAGYFCALYLARNGFRPIVVERGKAVDERILDVRAFWNNSRPVDKNSNVSFGEGGAGTFSDGKLNTGIKDPCGRIQAILHDFVRFGADEEITYAGKPHIGTDVLCTVMRTMREEIIKSGGEIRFSTTFVDYQSDHDGTTKVFLENGSNRYFLRTNALILALGHSARDTFRMLADKKLPMEQKAFAVGLRIEHLRKTVDEGQYGCLKAAQTLPAADYKMTYRTKEGRSVYSFCMCPGGFVVNAATDDGAIVVNGMSNHERNERNSNSAIVVNVTPDDFVSEGFSKDDVLSGMYFQQKYERLAYKEGKGAVPVQRFFDYELNNPTNAFGKVTPNLKGDFCFGNLNNCLPPYINNAIIEGVHAYAEKLSGFDDADALLSGVETRTSSPVRILRNEDCMSEIRGIFPCGEGAGYAGGITSAAVDGIRVAEAAAKYILQENAHE